MTSMDISPITQSGVEGVVNLAVLLWRCRGNGGTMHVGRNQRAYITLPSWVPMVEKNQTTKPTPPRGSNYLEKPKCLHNLFLLRVPVVVKHQTGYINFLLGVPAVGRNSSEPFFYVVPIVVKDAGRYAATTL